MRPGRWASAVTPSFHRCRWSLRSKLDRLPDESKGCRWARCALEPCRNRYTVASEYRADHRSDGSPQTGRGSPPIHWSTMNDASQGKRSHAMGSAFLRLWTFETISLFGTQITAITIPLTAIITLRATPLELGILAGARTAPWPVRLLSFRPPQPTGGSSRC